MYLSSTLYHSFYAVPILRSIFQVLDYSSIFLLIAGTYTPILLVGLAHNPFHSTLLFAAIWCVAIFGVGLSAIQDPSNSNWKTMTIIYVTMSYASLIAIKPFLETFDFAAALWLAAGGFWYTFGIYFLQRDEFQPILHTVWHVCVIIASVCHYFAILWHVIPQDSVDRPFSKMTLGFIIDNLFMGIPLTHYISRGWDLLISTFLVK